MVLRTAYNVTEGVCVPNGGHLATSTNTNINHKLDI
jgi:hypothetical protein